MAALYFLQMRIFFKIMLLTISTVSIDHVFGQKITYKQKSADFALLGVFGSNLDSIFSESLELRILEAIIKESELRPLDLRLHKKTIHNSFLKNGILDINQLSPISSLKNQRYTFAVIFEKKRDRLICRISTINLQREETLPVDEIVFTLDILYHPYYAADHIYKSILQHAKISSEKAQVSQIFAFTPPLTNAHSVINDRIIQPDSISYINTGTSLYTHEDFVHQAIVKKRIKYILYPNSHYIFYSSEVIEILEGSIGIMALSQPIEIFTVSMKCQILNSIVKLSHINGESNAQVFAGSITLKPILNVTEPDSVHAKFTASTRGYALTSRVMTAETMVGNFKVFTPHLTKDIIKFFKSSRVVYMEDPSYKIDYFRQQVLHPIDYFMASSFGELGISMDALLFEGEAWPNNPITFKPGFDETSCYLCRPDRTGSISP